MLRTQDTREPWSALNNIRYVEYARYVPFDILCFKLAWGGDFWDPQGLSRMCDILAALGRCPKPTVCT